MVFSELHEYEPRLPIREVLRREGHIRARVLT
jgi:hypothetical protein